jgi:ATP-dependent Lon protease
VGRRLALEVRRRVKEQQKRIGSAEFRNTHFSYILGEEGVEKFVATPELSSENSIGADPLEPGQVWTLSPGGMDEHSGLYRIEVNEGPGSGLRILNKPSPAAVPGVGALRPAEPLRRVPCSSSATAIRVHTSSRSSSGASMRPRRAARSASRLCSGSAAAYSRSHLRGGLVVIGEINLGGSLEPIHNAVTWSRWPSRKAPRRC